MTADCNAADSDDSAKSIEFDPETGMNIFLSVVLMTACPSQEMEDELMDLLDECAKNSISTISSRTITSLTSNSTVGEGTAEYEPYLERAE
ncbi:hypothetical protein DMJ13_18930 [halophilic archaeon]|nr:hypothetical protein DMJ13_18930 [halophilic archaeon]